MNIKISEYIQPNYNNKKILNWLFFQKLNNISFWNNMFDSPVLELDLNGVDVFSSDGVIWLQNIFLYRKVNNNNTLVVLSEDKKINGYLNFIGFNRYFHVSVTLFL